MVLYQVLLAQVYLPECHLCDDAEHDYGDYRKQHYRVIARPGGRVTLARGGRWSWGAKRCWCVQFIHKRSAARSGSPSHSCRALPDMGRAKP